MNRSSLFSFEESSVCDPKIIRKHMVVPQDQLIKLNSIPGWTKVETCHNTLRLDKDFSIENSQSKCFINATQTSQRIEKNTELFNEQIENHKKILTTYKVYGGKLTRSTSLFTISTNYDSISNRKALKRTLSLQSVYQSSDASNINIHFKEFRCENSSERQSLSYFSKINVALTNQCKISVSEPEKEEEFPFGKEANSKIMETVSQLPVSSISAFVENSNSHFETTKESNQMLPAETIAAGPSNVSDQLMKHVTESANADKVDLLPEIAKESNPQLPAENVASCSNNESDEPAKIVSEFNVDNCIISSLNEFTESHVPVSVESYKSDTSSVKEVQADVISAPAPVSAFDTLNTKLLEGPSFSISVDDECIILHCPVEKIALKNVMTSVDRSNDLKLPESCPSKSEMLDNPAKDLPISKKETALEDVHLNRGSDSDKVNDLKNDQDECIILHWDSVEKIAPKNAMTSASGSNDLKLPEFCPGKPVTSDKPAKELSIPKKEAVSETEHLIRDSGADKVNLKSDQKECDHGKTHDLAKSSANNEASVSKKRKLESKHKRSKRLKSEEKQSNIKIRSIKKVGEVCYSVEEVKTMLDIMKQFL